MLGWGQYSLATYTIPMLHADGLTVAAAGILLAVAQAGGAAARMLLGHLSDWLGARRELVLMGTAACGAALACVVAILPPHVPGVVLTALWFLLGASMVGWNALLLTWSGERVSMHNAGAAIGLTTSAVLAGATVSAPAFGFIVERSGGYRTAWFSLAAVLAGAALLLWAQQGWSAREAAAMW
jgi:predicted MFS family arabinose efflux permease